NLISNAIKYGKNGRKIEVRVQLQQGMAAVKVINFGEPIREQDLPYVFERFYRTDKSRSEETGGTGLGLAIARSIVEMHQVTISVESSREQTSFEVRLPLSK